MPDTLVLSMTGAAYASILRSRQKFFELGNYEAVTAIDGGLAYIIYEMAERDGFKNRLFGQVSKDAEKLLAERHDCMPEDLAEMNRFMTMCLTKANLKIIQLKA